MLNETITTDNYKLAYTKFTASDTASKVMLIGSATGVKQEFYSNYASFMAQSGVTVYTFDYRGIGKSRDVSKPFKQLNAYMHEWGEKDIKHMIQLVKDENPDKMFYYLGHSVGGQLLGIADNNHLINKVILYGAQSGFWKYWKANGLKSGIWMYSNWHILFPVFITLFGYFPAKRLGLFEDLPKGVATEWSSWGRHKDYLQSSGRASLQYFKQIKTPILAVSVEDDDFAPHEAVNWITDMYENGIVNKIHLVPTDYNLKKLGHFGFFRSKYKEVFWGTLLKQVDEIHTSD